MDLFNLLHYVTALIFVAALAGVAFLVKRYGSNPAAFKDSLPWKMPGKLSGKLGKWNFTAPQRRLVVVESLMVGPKQRLLIIRRDDVEHLVLASADGATVIESNIPSASSMAPSGLRSASAAAATSPLGADAQGEGAKAPTP